MQYNIYCDESCHLQNDKSNVMVLGAIWCAKEKKQEIYYKDLPEPIGTRRADFVVEGKVLVELKAIIQLEDVHLAQALNYLKAYKLDVGLLINFGSKSLTFKRLVL